MSLRPPHLLLLIVDSVAHHAPDALIALSQVSTDWRALCLAHLFADVHWPHAAKHDDETGLLFFPESLWPYIKRFRLDWPDDWPEASPPCWGDKYYEGGDYHPRHLDRLVAALPNMPALASFYISCPFYPPSAVLTALIQCPALRDLTIADTPLYIATMPKVPASLALERLAIVPVAEAVRVGEGPYDPRYSEVAYYLREYRKKYKHDVLARYAAQTFLFQIGRPAALRHIQVSSELCSIDALALHHWPALETLVLTGHAPRGTTPFLDLLGQMPRLQELRLLFAKTKVDPPFRILAGTGDTSPPQSSASNSYPTSAPRTSSARHPPSTLAQLRRLALSNACDFGGVLRHAVDLERLAVCAIIDMPRLPTALSRRELDDLLQDIAAASSAASSLIQLRIMIEDKVSPILCQTIAGYCPNLENLEIELCGYHDGKSVHAWAEFADAFAQLPRLTHLRICIQFPEFDETDSFEPWRAARRECATFLAARIPTLARVGLEYRKRTGTHRFEDSWLEFDVDRDEAGTMRALRDVPPSWYPFPEVWKPQALPG